jgi:hypothetical protein
VAIDDSAFIADRSIQTVVVDRQPDAFDLGKGTVRGRGKVAVGPGFIPREGDVDAARRQVVAEPEGVEIGRTVFAAGDAVKFMVIGDVEVVAAVAAQHGIAADST